MRGNQRYFVYGIVVTSLVWGFALVLYNKMDQQLSSGTSMQYYEQIGEIELKQRLTGRSDKTGMARVDPLDDTGLLDVNHFNREEEEDARFKHKGIAGMRYPQKDEEEKQRHMEEVQRLQSLKRSLGKKEKTSFDDFMYYKQHVFNDKYHNEQIMQAKKPGVKESEVLRADTGGALEDLGLIRSPEDQKLRDEGERLHAFNLLISNRLSYHRDIPDTRDGSCETKTYSDGLPTASVVICFHNEAMSALLRTVHSVVDRTPSHLLHEIVLVDDFSTLMHLGKELEDYIAEKFTNVHLHRTLQREGLIRARILGASKATGKVLIFLDSHCEVNQDWLPPLLDRIHTDPSTVTIPIVDIIDQDTFRYEPSPLVRGGFNWGMHFRWDNIPQSWYRDHGVSDPVPTPTMSGGLFAIEREYFEHMGSYDPGLDIWGGENLEISFRIWQCGGRLEIVPCSRVGHVFRKRRPYSSPGGDAMLHNSLRVAHVWMDDYKEHYFKVRSDASKGKYGNITDRLELRKQLDCKSFKWYLENVYPEQTLPDDTGKVAFPKFGFPRKDMPKIVRDGHLQHRTSKLCVGADGDAFTKRALLKLVECKQEDKELVWRELDNYSIQLAGQLCLDVENTGQGEAFPRIMKCHFSGGSQEWKWIGHFQTLLYNPATGKCLSVERSRTGSFLTIEICNENTPGMQFDMRPWL